MTNFIMFQVASSTTALSDTTGRMTQKGRKFRNLDGSSGISNDRQES